MIPVEIPSDDNFITLSQWNEETKASETNGMNTPHVISSQKNKYLSLRHSILAARNKLAHSSNLLQISTCNQISDIFKIATLHWDTGFLTRRNCFHSNVIAIDNSVIRLDNSEKIWNKWSKFLYSGTASNYHVSINRDIVPEIIDTSITQKTNWPVSHHAEYLVEQARHLSKDLFTNLDVLRKSLTYSEIKIAEKKVKKLLKKTASVTHLIERRIDRVRGKGWRSASNIVQKQFKAFVRPKIPCLTLNTIEGGATVEEEEKVSAILLRRNFFSNPTLQKCITIKNYYRQSIMC